MTGKLYAGTSGWAYPQWKPDFYPAKLAAQLGFRGSTSKTQTWKTLETGCGNELDYHFLDPSTAAFGLNNYVYILKKQ